MVFVILHGYRAAVHTACPVVVSVFAFAMCTANMRRDLWRFIRPLHRQRFAMASAHVRFVICLEKHLITNPKIIVSYTQNTIDSDGLAHTTCSRVLKYFVPVEWVFSVSDNVRWSLAGFQLRDQCLSHRAVAYVNNVRHYSHIPLMPSPIALAQSLATSAALDAVLLIALPTLRTTPSAKLSRP